MEDDSKSLKTLAFSGKKADFMMWQAKFLSYANFKSFKGVLLGKEKLIKVKVEAGETLSDEQKKTNETFLKANNQAYSLLHMCVKDPVSFQAIYNAMTDDMPEGDAYLAWQNLHTKF